MIDCVFFVTSALRVNGKLSIYSDEERFQQTIKTVESIQKYCPSNSIHLIDASHENLSEDQLDIMSRMGVDVYKCSEKHDIIRDLAIKGHKSVCELAILKFFFQEYAPKREDCKRFYKLSGRYWLNDNFKHSFEHENSFVFLKAVDSWMPQQIIQQTGMKKFYETRMYNLDSKIFDLYVKEIDNIIDTCIKYNVNIEHSIYHNLNKYNPIELEKVGVNGYISPSGEFKDD